MPGLGLLQPMHLIMILAIVLIVFGAGKLGQVGGALGQSVKDFKKSVNAEEEEEAAPPVAAAPAKVQPAPAAHPAELLHREEI